MEFRRLRILVGRHVRIYFKDKTSFFVSLITPMILVVLFLTFMGQVYSDALAAAMPEGVQLSTRFTRGFVGGWFFSSILATSCITVAFCSNVMVNDKLNRAVNDFHLTPVRKTTLGLSYFLANWCTTLIVCMTALGLGFVYLAVVGWYLGLGDVVMLIALVWLNTLFGTLLASIIEMFINTQGALSAVCTLVSSMYGFICGAYMPLAQFASGIRTVLGCLPTTYCTILLRYYFMRGSMDNLRNNEQVPDGTAEQVQGSFDGQITMFGQVVPLWAMWLIVLGAVLVLLLIYLLLLKLQSRCQRPRTRL